ncbi:unnamed protein product [Rotaria magnacalcarata]
MDNTTSDSLDHSFKRLRLSHTEQVWLPSPSSTSPRRKITTNFIQHFSRTFENRANDSNDRSPVLLCDTTNSYSLIASSSFQPSQSVVEQNCNEQFILSDSYIAAVALSKTPDVDNQEISAENDELSDDQILMLLRSTKQFHDLLDSDIIDCLKLAYSKKTLAELVFVLNEDARIPPFDKFRIPKIATAVRHTFMSDQPDECVKMLIGDLSTAYCQTRPMHKQNSLSSIMVHQNDHLLVPFRTSCPTCNRSLDASDAIQKRVRLYRQNGSVVIGMMYTLNCQHKDSTSITNNDNSSISIYPNFTRSNKCNVYTHNSLHHGDYIYLGGDVAIERSIIDRYTAQIVHNGLSMIGLASTMNQEAFNLGNHQLAPIERRLLRNILHAYLIIQFDLSMGNASVSTPDSLEHFSQWGWEQFPRLLTCFIYLWTNHRTLIGSCVAGQLAPTCVYDDGCHLVKYIKNHIGNELAQTPAMLLLNSTPISVDRSHFRNHVGTFCRQTMNPDKNPLLDGVNTQAAEQTFSWLKQYAKIISNLNYLRAPLFMLASSIPNVHGVSLCHLTDNKSNLVSNSPEKVPMFKDEKSADSLDEHRINLPKGITDWDAVMLDIMSKHN